MTAENISQRHSGGLNRVGTDDNLSSRGLFLRDIKGYIVPNRSQVDVLIQGIESQTPLSEILLSSVFDPPFRKAYANCTSPYEVMCLGNQGLVVKISGQFERSSLGGSLEFLDLVNFGNEGLGKAIRNFKRQKGFAFSTYADKPIRGAISDGIRNAGFPVPIPKPVLRSLRRSGKDRQEFAEVVNSGIMDPISLNHPEFTDGYADTDRSVVSAEDVEGEVQTKFTRETINKAVAGLKPREALVLQLHYGLKEEPPRTLAEISSLLDVSEARVGQIERNALNKLRDILNRQLPSYCHPNAVSCHPTTVHLRPEPALGPPNGGFELYTNGTVTIIQKAEGKRREA